MGIRIPYSTPEEAELIIKAWEADGCRLIRQVDHFDERYVEFEEVIIIPPELTREIKI